MSNVAQRPKQPRWEVFLYKRAFGVTGGLICTICNTRITSANVMAQMGHERGHKHMDGIKAFLGIKSRDDAIRVLFMSNAEFENLLREKGIGRQQAAAGADKKAST